MTEEKWQDIIGQIKDEFKVLEQRTEALENMPGQVEYIIFEGPVGKMKLEFTTKPLVLDKKGLGSRRIGSRTKVEYIYSDTEKVHTFKAYKWDEARNEWVEMEAELGFKSL